MTITVHTLSQDLGIDSSELIVLLGKLGLKKATEETYVPDAIADNIKAASTQRQKVLTFEKPPTKSQPKENQETVAIEEVSRKLKPSEIQNIAQACQLTQVVVKGLEKAQHNRETQIAFLQGYQNIQRKQQQEIALQSGKIAAQLQALKERDRYLSEQEAELIEDGLETAEYHPAAIAAKLGIDLDGLYSELQASTEKYTMNKISQQDAIAKVKLGEKPTDEELNNPFVLLAYKRQAN